MTKKIINLMLTVLISLTAVYNVSAEEVVNEKVIKKDGVDVTYTEIKRSGDPDQEVIDSVKKDMAEEDERLRNISENATRKIDERGYIEYVMEDSEDGGIFFIDYNDGRGSVNVSIEEFRKYGKQSTEEVVDMMEHPHVNEVVDEWTSVTTNINEHEEAVRVIEELRKKKKEERERQLEEDGGWDK